MAKSHFITSNEPLTELVCTAVCGKPVEKLAAIETDFDLQRLDLRSLISCKKCQQNLEGRYLYIGVEHG